MRFFKSTGARTAGLYFLALIVLGTGAIPTTAAIIQFQSTGQLPEGMEDTARYLGHLELLFAHVAAGALFVLLGPLQFIADLRGSRPRVHRISGRIFVGAGITMALTGLAMLVILPPFGPIALPAGTAAISLTTLVLIIVAFAAILRRDIVTHRIWMIRAYAVGMSVATQRMTIIPLFVIFGMPDLNLVAGLIWFSLVFNLGVAEWIIRRPRPAIMPA